MLDVTYLVKTGHVTNQTMVNIYAGVMVLLDNQLMIVEKTNEYQQNIVMNVVPSAVKIMEYVTLLLVTCSRHFVDVQMDLMVNIAKI